MKISFLGAAGEVTGSQHLIETDSRRILLDCGLFQGHRQESYLKNSWFAYPPDSIDAVFLSHGHMDHCGNLPRLFSKGFRGPIFCTSATADIAEIMLKDSARIQAEDAKYLARKLKEKHPPIEPLYSEEDVDGVAKLFERLDYHEWHELGDDVKLRFLDAGHILGSAIIEMKIKDQREWRHLVFTGDLGRRNLPLLRDPETIEGCEVLISESTYGNRVHEKVSDIKEELYQILDEAYRVEGRVIIPAFSLGRTQQIIYYLNELYNEKRLPHIPIFVDSPLSTRLVSVFRHHLHEMDDEVQAMMEADKDPFGFALLDYVSTREQSIALNKRKGAFVVIAGSGMCENGRVRHHLKNGIDNIENTIVLMGYQAANTLGRRLQQRDPKVKIFDRYYKVKAKVVQLSGLSGHADVEDFKWWYAQSAKLGNIGQVFLVHGEPESAEALAALIRDECDLEPIIPHYQQSFEV
ncbi:MBL fold metallo-hydrolase RNA specificity domain-containing protein [Gimesia fumaroli]|uniref:Ribonuclease n=1 Tax=Gimesia fumaroli TaxID=2527976 RepID=A0A518I6U2_9PLAN|nr:MBL fold metallo-hydrolase [Gimesia fumaroli]QDV48789.1 Ribonuclease [Gimesia fumaroli]